MNKASKVSVVTNLDELTDLLRIATEHATRLSSALSRINEFQIEVRPQLLDQSSEESVLERAPGCLPSGIGSR